MSFFTRIIHIVTRHPIASGILSVLAIVVLVATLGYVPPSPSAPFHSPLTAPVKLQATGQLKSLECNAGQVLGLVQKNDNQYMVTFDLTNGQERKLTDKPLLHAHLSDHWLVYIDEMRTGDSGDYSRLKVIDINTGQEISLSRDNAFQSSPSVSGNIVVWMDSRNDASDIYAYNLVTRTEFPVVAGAGQRGYPRVSGDWVIYLQWTKSPTGHDIITAELRAHSLKTNDDFAIGNTPFANDSFFGTYHAIDGHVVAWVEFAGGIESTSLHLYDLDTRSDRILIGRVNSGLWHPSVSNDAGLLAYSTGNMLDWFQPTPEPVMTEATGHYELCMDGNYLIWKMPFNNVPAMQAFASKISR